MRMWIKISKKCVDGLKINDFIIIICIIYFRFQRLSSAESKKESRYSMGEIRKIDSVDSFDDLSDEEDDNVTIPLSKFGNVQASHSTKQNNQNDFPLPPPEL